VGTVGADAADYGRQVDDRVGAQRAEAGFDLLRLEQVVLGVGRGFDVGKASLL